MVTPRRAAALAAQLVVFGLFAAALGYAGKASGTVTDSTKTGLGVLCTKYALPGALFKFMGSLNLTYIEPGVIGAVVIANIALAPRNPTGPDYTTHEGT